MRTRAAELYDAGYGGAGELGRFRAAAHFDLTEVRSHAVPGADEMEVFRRDDINPASTIDVTFISTDDDTAC